MLPWKTGVVCLCKRSPCFPPLIGMWTFDKECHLLEPQSVALMTLSCLKQVVQLLSIHVRDVSRKRGLLSQ